MVTSDQIGLALLQAALVAFPLWLAVLRYSIEDIKITKEDDHSDWVDEYGTILVFTTATGFNSMALVGAFVIAGTVVMGYSDKIGAALVLVSLFIFVSAFQVIMGVSSRISKKYGARGELLTIVGIMVGIFLVFSVFQLM